MLRSINYFCNVFGEKKAIDVYSQAGFDALDFSFFNSKYYTDETSTDFYRELKEYADAKGVKFNQAHAPFPSSYNEDDRTKEAFTAIVTSMKNASLLGVPNIVVHPCQHLDYSDDGVPEKLFEMNPGLRDRIPYRIHFPNYNRKELEKIYFKIILNSSCFSVHC